MHLDPHAPMRRRLSAALLSIAALGGVHAHAQEAPVQAPVAPTPIGIDTSRSAGDLPYKSFFTTQALLQSFLPPEPRTIDMRYRLSFRDPADAARIGDGTGPWAVAIVGTTFEQVVPVARGGYFLLPDLPQALRENATVLFNAQTQGRNLEAVFTLRLSAQQTLAYADFARALREFRAVQDQVPWYRFGLRAIRNAGMDGLKACFRSPDGRIEIDGAPAQVLAQGACQILRFDPAASGQTIGFVGQLENVTLHDRGD